MGLVEDWLSSKFPGDDLSKVGIGGFTAYASINETVTLTSDVASTVLEDGSEREQNIVNRAKTIDISGVVADIFIEPSNVDRFVADVGGLVNELNQYLPDRSAAALQKVNGVVNDAANAINRIDTLIDKGKQVTDLLGLTEPNDNNYQQTFFEVMEKLHDSKQLIEIQTKFRNYQNCRIVDLSFTKNNEIGYTEFFLTAQQVRLQEIIAERVDSSQTDESLGGQTENNVNKGVQQPEESERSLLSAILG